MVSNADSRYLAHNGHYPSSVDASPQKKVVIKVEWTETAKDVALYVATRGLALAGLGMFIAGCVLSGGTVPLIIGSVGLAILGVYAAYWVCENGHMLSNAMISMFKE